MSNMTEQVFQSYVDKIKQAVNEFRATHNTCDLAIERLKGSFNLFDAMVEDELVFLVERVDNEGKRVVDGLDEVDTQLDAVISQSAKLIKSYFTIPPTTEEIEAEKMNPEAKALFQ